MGMIKRNLGVSYKENPKEYRKRYKELIKTTPIPSSNTVYSQSKEYYSEYYKINKEKINKKSKERKADLRVSILDGIRYRSKRRNEVCELTLEDILIPEYCPVFNWIKLEKTKTKNTTPSPDRIDSSLGYTKENTVIMSTRANLIKGDATLDELIALGKWAERIKKAYG